MEESVGITNMDPGHEYAHDASSIQNTGGFPIPPNLNQYPPTTMPSSGTFPPSGPPPSYTWMPHPVQIGGLPGLDYLTTIDRLLVKQQIELLEVITNIETPNRYLCLNTSGQIVYSCAEESDFFNQQFLRASRPFVMHIFDNSGNEVIRVHRPYKYTCISKCCNCSKCCQDEVQVEAPVGTPVGCVKQLYRGCDIRYDVCDAQQNSVLRIQGPSYCSCECFGQNIDFRIMSVSGFVELGKISKQWSGTIQELVTDADNFGVAFPLDLDVRIKAVLIGAVFLIDFMFFENGGHRRNH